VHLLIYHSVYQTLKFALTNKTKKNEKHEIPIILDALLKVFGISHTKYTKVGDEYVRGVSGGERKRVSIAETLATKVSSLSTLSCGAIQGDFSLKPLSSTFNCEAIQGGVSLDLFHT
jgi:ABC-type hemin transport system ATPase subunit